MYHVAQLSARNDGSVLLFMLFCLTVSCLFSGSYTIGIIKPMRLLEQKVRTAGLKLNVWHRTSESSAGAWDGGGSRLGTT